MLNVQTGEVYILHKRIRLSGLLSIILLFALGSDLVFASSGITYHGRLLSPDGTPVISSSVQFQMQIRTPGAEDCLMYEEIQNLDLSATSGMFSISLGDGSGARQDSNSWGLFESFSNRKTFNFSASDCNGLNTYTPNGLDNRKFRVSFNDGTFTGWEVLPLQTINYIPMAIESYTVGGFPASALLRVEDAGTLGTPSALTTTQYNEILALVSGTSSQYEQNGELNGSSLPTISSGESVRWTGSAWQSFTPLTSETDPNVEAFAKSSLPTCATGEVLKSNGTSLSCVTDAGGWSAVDATTTVKGIVVVPTTGGLEVTSGAIGLPDVVTGGTYTKVTVDDKGRVTTGANITGSDITSGTIGGSTSISTTGSISSASLSTRQIDLYDSDNTHHISFLTPATTDLTTNYDLVFPATLGTSNQILGMNNAGDALENKSITAGSGVTITHSAGGIAIAATGSGGTVTSVSGTSPISVATGTTTPVISLDDAGTAGTYGSATEVPVFTTDAKGRVTAVTETTISGVSPVGSALSSGQVWVGDGSNVAAQRYFGVEDLKTVLGAMQIPTACTSKQTMIWSAVTDVFSCTDISITASQVSDLDLTDYVEVAGDTMTGALNLPSNGIVVGTDELVVSGGNVGIGTTAPLTPLDVRGVDNTNMLSVGTSTDMTSNILLRGFNGTVRAEPGRNLVMQAQGSGRFYVQTNGANRLMVNDAGNVGIGTTSPSSKLDIYEGSLTVQRETNNKDTSIKIRTAGGGGAYSLVYGQKSNGDSLATPTAVVANDTLLRLLGEGHDGTAYGGRADIAFKAEENFTTTANGTYISFGTTSAGTTAINPTERMRITSNGDVGIGTDNPSTMLEVVGTIKATSFEGPLNATTSSIGDGSAASPSMTFTNDSNTGFYSSGADSIGISAGGSQVWNITTSSIVSPTTGGGSMSSVNGTASAPTFSFAGDLDTGWFRPAADTLAAATAGVERVRIDSAGNVGIGTTNTTIKFSVAAEDDGIADEYKSNAVVRLSVNPAGTSATSYRAFGGNLSYEGPGDSTATDLVANSGYATNNSAATVDDLIGHSGNSVNTSTGQITNATGVYGSAVNSGVGGVIENAYGGRFGTWTTGPTINNAYGVYVGQVRGTNKFSLYTSDSAAPSYFSGSVGIGATVPTSKLTISNNTAALPTPPSAGETLAHLASADTQSTRLVLDSFGTGTSGNSNLTFRSANGTAAVPSATASGDLLGQISWFGHGATAYSSGTRATIRGVATESWTDTAQGAAITFLTTANSTGGSNYERMRIDQSGFVGIGTTVPGSLLHVNAADTSTSVTGLTVENRGITDISSTSAIQIDFKLADTNTDNPTNPQARIGVFPGDSGSGYEDEASGQLVFYTALGDYATGTPNVNTLNERMRIDQYGNIGIGTTTPGRRLEVQGNTGIIRAADSNNTTAEIAAAAYLEFQATDGRMGWIGDGSSASNDISMVSDLGGINLVTSGNTRLAVESSGNVGIGTTVPRDKVDVWSAMRVSRSGNQYLQLFGGDATYTSLYVQANSTEGNKKPLILQSFHNASGSPAGKLGFTFQVGTLASPTTVVQIEENGDVGIGTTLPDSRLVVYNGTTTGRYTTTGWTHVSDVRLKHDIAPLENSLEKILQLRGVEYKFKTDKDRRTQVGFIAQEVEPIFPEVVNTDERGFKSMVYSNLVAPLVEAVKELFEISEDHSRAIASVKVENAQLKAESVAKDQKIEELEEELETIKARLSKIEELINNAK